MALTRAQLISGDVANGAIISGQPQGVRPGGAGITIATNGVISVNSQTVQGVMKLGQTPASAAAAYNGYTWPIGPGTAGQQLTTDGAGLLSWANPSASPYTAKGQLVVGIGLAADTLLNVGTNTAVLMADSGTTSGLIYSNAVTSAMQSPAGTTVQRPNPATAGQFRYNTNTQKFEFATGPTTWEQFASADPAVGTFVSQTVPTTGSPSAIIPTGTTAQQQTVPAPLAGYTRFNTTTSLMEVFDGTVWNAIGAGAVTGVTGTLPIVSSGGAAPVISINAATTALFGSVQLADAAASQAGTSPTLVSTPAFSVPKDAANMTGAALISGGNNAARPATPVTGMLRYNSQTLPAFMEFWDSAAWTAVGAPPVAGLGIDISVVGSIVKVSIPTVSTPPVVGAAAAQAIDGSFYWDSTLGQLFIRYNDGTTSQWVAAAPPGGGGGSTYTGTAPIVVTGTVISLNQGLGVATNGTNLAFKMPVAATPPAIGTGAAQAFDGSMYWDDTLGQLFIRYINGGTSTWVAAAPPAGGVPAASLAEAAAGVTTVKYSSPATAVPKDTAGMGGAALLPSGGNYAGTTTGMFRFNTTSNHVEFYDGSAWQTSVNRSGDTMTGPLSINIASNITAINVTGVIAAQIMNATGGVNAAALTQYQTSVATYNVGTSDSYLGNIFYINSSAIAGQAGSQLGFGMFPNGVTHMATVNTNLASGPFVRVGPAVTTNSAGLARLVVESRDVGGTGFVCEWYNNSPTAIGSITVSGLGVNYNNTSDYRLKENVFPLVNSIDRLKLLNPVHYNYKEHPEAPQDGFIAHEVQSVVPAAVTGNKDGVNEEGAPVYQGLDTSKLVPLLTASLQEAVSRIEALEVELAALKGA